MSEENENLSDSSTIEISIKKPTVKDGWLCMGLRKISAHVKKVGANGKVMELWLTEEADPNIGNIVAHQIYTGVGPRPEGTIILQDVCDVMYNLIMDIERTIDKVDVHPEEGQDEKENDTW